jgi:hypothetical protein
VTERPAGVPGRAFVAFLYGMAFLIGTAENVPRAVGLPLITATVENHLLERANGRLFASQAVALQFVGPLRHKALRVVTVSATANLCIAMATLVLFAGADERRLRGVPGDAGVRWGRGWAACQVTGTLSRRRWC